MPCPNSLEEWEAASREIVTIANQGGNDPFLADLLIAVFNEFGRKYAERIKHETIFNAV